MKQKMNGGTGFYAKVKSGKPMAKKAKKGKSKMPFAK